MKTVESVTEGHPDKVCDQIADAILDAYLQRDPLSRVAIEVFGSHGAVMIGGEVTSSATIDIPAIAQRVYRDIGYTDEIEVFTNVDTQSPEIAQSVDAGAAGDQGIMYGYATTETPEYMPQPVVTAHALALRLASLRKNTNEFAWLGPDGKVQVTYDKGVPTAIVVSAQHAPVIAPKEFRHLLMRRLVEPVVGEGHAVRLFINPGGPFTVGGFSADTGLTGRKIMVDTYGGLVPHGGGAFSGKDPSKVDRSAAYMARFAAKNIVANGLAKSCLVSVAYVIGKEEPIMLRATSGEGKDLTVALKQHFDFRPRAIIERLDLRRPIYQSSSCYGHFGRDQFPWEHIVLF